MQGLTFISDDPKEATVGAHTFGKGYKIIFRHSTVRKIIHRKHQRINHS